MTAPFNERLSEILGDCFEAEPAGYFDFDRAEAAILSLFREVVEEAKPEVLDESDEQAHRDVLGAIGYNSALDQYHASLLQQLGEKK